MKHGRGGGGVEVGIHKLAGLLHDLDCGLKKVEKCVFKSQNGEMSVSVRQDGEEFEKRLRGCKSHSTAERNISPRCSHQTDTAAAKTSQFPPLLLLSPNQKDPSKKTFGFGGGGGGGTVHKRRPLVSSPSKRKDDLKGAFKSFTLPSNFHGTTKKITLCSMVPGYHICLLDVFYVFFRIFLHETVGRPSPPWLIIPAGGGDGPNGQTERRRRQRCFVLRKKSF